MINTAGTVYDSYYKAIEVKHRLEFSSQDEYTVSIHYVEGMPYYTVSMYKYIPENNGSYE